MNRRNYKAVVLGAVTIAAVAPLLTAGCQPQSVVRSETIVRDQRAAGETAADVARRNRQDAIPSSKPLAVNTDPRSATGGDKVWDKGKCASCHGEYGRGDGPEAARQGTKLPDFTAFDYTRDKTPLSLYVALSGKDHPHPFGNPDEIGTYLTDQERWDVVYYIWQMHSTYDSLTKGATLFVVNCSVCHGTKGFGNGQLAHTLQPLPRNFTVFDWMMDKPDNRFYRSIMHGRKWTAMPAWGELPEGKGLTDEQIYLIIDYLRTYNYTYPREIIPESGGGH